MTQTSEQNGFLIEFCDFLNQNGFSVSSRQQLSALDMISQVEIESDQQTEEQSDKKKDQKEKDDSLIRIFNVVFSKTPEQTTLLPKLFHYFQANQERITHKKEEDEQPHILQGIKSDLNMRLKAMKAESKSEREKLEERLKKEADQKFDQWWEQEFSKSFDKIENSLRLIGQLQKKLEESGFQSFPQATTELGQVLEKTRTASPQAFGNFLLGSQYPAAMEQASSWILDSFQKNDKAACTWQGAISDLLILVRLEMEKMEAASAQKRNELNREIKKQLLRFDAEQNKRARGMADEIQKTQKSIDEIVRKQKETVPDFIKKLAAQNHRPEFDGGTSAVQTLRQDFLMDDGLLQTNLTSLSAEEQKQIYEAIRKNALALKTRMRRNIQSTERRTLDVGATIRTACKTGGIPLQLQFRQPRPNKTRIVLVLDISGSCIRASQMMLTLLHSLVDVFPGGIQAFAFVNSLYDISRIMETEDVNEAVRQVFAIIPTRGVYSDYSKPLQTLWKEHRQAFTSETMTIFIGDARNNRNESCEGIFKQISRTSKVCWWLNTESPKEWNTADSIAGIYGQYARMIPVLSTEDLLNFMKALH